MFHALASILAATPAAPVDPTAAAEPAAAVATPDAIATLTVLMGIGLILWIAGKRVLRPAFALLAGLLGALIGMELADRLQLGVPDWAAAGVLGLVAAAFGLMIVQVVLTAGLALVLAMLSPLLLWSVHDTQARRAGQPPTETAPLSIVQESWSDAGGDGAGGEERPWWLRGPGGASDDESAAAGDDASAGSIDPGLAEEIESMRERLADHAREAATASLPEPPPAARTGLGVVLTLVDRVTGTTLGVWDRMPLDLQPILAIAALLGGLTGLMIGAFSPQTAAVVVSAAGGAILWLPAGCDLLARSSLANAGPLPLTGAGWLTAWAAAAAIGVVLQVVIWRTRRAARTSN